ncbi:MAG: UDP-N-acetylmuramate dehydrogenase [Patescibacteria group bacterium]|jgi:UDP-N-acetylmuramate dehydrogenase|nr:UDP-N-acetylmuramate dehydrogenase [Patescibacteria group bacterium]
MNFSEDFTNKYGKNIEENILLRDFTSIGVGGVADYFYRAQRVEDMVGIVSYLAKEGIPYFVLGGGYNIVVSDLGFPGFVIKNEIKDIVFSQDKAEVIVGSGVEISRLLMDSASRDLGGLEFLFGIPGTIGGAVYGNAGAFGHTIGDFVRSATVLFPGNEEKKTKIVRHTAKWFEFSNRSSKIKSFSQNHPMENKPIILSVRLQLCQSKKEVILRKIQENFKIKRDSQPLDGKSAGCIFKNLGVGKEQSAGFLIDQAGGKRFRVGDAVVSKKHANFILNRNKATAEDIRRLASQIKDLVRAEYRVGLDEEIEYVGKW